MSSRRIYRTIGRGNKRVFLFPGSVIAPLHDLRAPEWAATRKRMLRDVIDLHNMFFDAIEKDHRAPRQPRKGQR